MTDPEAKVPIPLPPDVNNCLIWKDPDAGKDWRQEEKGMMKDEMVGCHHWLNGHEFEQALGSTGKVQGSLTCCSPWGLEDSDMTQRLNNNNRLYYFNCTKASKVIISKSNLWLSHSKPSIPTLSSKKGNQSCIFIGRSDAEAEAPILQLLDSKSQLIGKDADAGKVWRQEKGVTEDEMVGWHHWFNGHEFEETPGDGE